MKATKDELFKYSAALLAHYDIPLEFLQDAQFLENAIDKVAEELNIVCVECDTGH